MRRNIVALFLFGALLSAVLGFSTLTHADLIDNGVYYGQPGILIYDTGLNITWYDRLPSYMTWVNATAWTSGLTVGGTAAGSWTLPTVLPVNGSTYNYNNSYNGSTDFGYNISAPGSAYPGSTANQMAYLYYCELGNEAPNDVNGNPQTGYVLWHTGPFANLWPSIYWSGTNDSSRNGAAWVFNLGAGTPGDQGESGYFYALAVHSGDVLGDGEVLPDGPSTPIPGAILLFAPGLVGLAAIRRRLKK